MTDNEIVKFKIGAVVKRKEDSNLFSNCYGHVVGFDRNEDNELLICIKFEKTKKWDGFPIHPSRLELL